MGRGSEALRDLLRLLAVLALPIAIWVGARLVLRVQHPFLYVVSESMRPTLEVGDLIVVEGVGELAIRTGRDGDVIAFYQPGHHGDPDHIIIHRAVGRTIIGGVWHFTTKGDNNPFPDPWKVSPEDIVGRYVLRIPYLGYLFILLSPMVRTSAGGALTACLIIGLIAWTLYDALRRR